MKRRTNPAPKRQRGYLHRLEVAFTNHPHYFGEPEVVSPKVMHDTWCRSSGGKPCNCFPDIVVETKHGAFCIDEAGVCSPIKGGYRRPRLDLPEGHPLRKHLDDNDCKVQPPNEDGVSIVNFLDHHKARKVVSHFLPELVERAKKAPLSQAVIGVQHWETDAGFLLIYGGFLPPDEDDPDRVESGWFAVLYKGPREMLDYYRSTVERTARSHLK